MKNLRNLNLSLSLILALCLPLTAIAASKAEIDANVEVALERFYEESPAGKRLSAQASGMLVFPRVLKAGIGIGGEYGEGALLINGSTAEYYSTASASIGFQLALR